MAELSTYDEAAEAHHGMSLVIVDDDETTNDANGDLDLLPLGYIRNFRLYERWVITIADDSVGYWDVPSSYGNAVHVFVLPDMYNLTPDRNNTTSFWFLPGNNAIENLNASVGSNDWVDLGDNITPTGTTGADVKLNISAVGQRIYVENRLGSSRDLYAYFIRDLDAATGRVSGS